ncbi:DnaD domain protein [Ktedonosporobacter rubrisoli]|uniref:DnaD domain protein n=1 Tax=Ktedonosporobacter rubrisoli TaxID=2509675 RepID=A0A4V0YZU0_KTERU|nr:DnaD domain protein [Ktedonosporobacter rubrisoli]QBD80891.1 DnaD domain protein [Ktedonosporobacter rubrisoli]
MMTFAGFPASKNSPYVPVPEVFFTQVLPDIEDSAELKVTLHIFWSLAQKRGNPRCISDHELEADRLLIQSLRRRGDPRPPEERLRQGLDEAVARGTLLRIYLKLVSEGRDEAEVIGWYFLNTARSRKAVAELQGGEIVPVRLLDGEHVGQQDTIAAGDSSSARGPGLEMMNTLQNVQVQIERPNIFVLYEQNVGLLSPLIAEELKDAAERYPAEWIEDAFREAVQQNKRKWSYIRAILRRWETEGKQKWNA